MKRQIMICKSLKRLLFPLTCFLFVLQTHAQQSHRFADTSAVWHFSDKLYSMFPPFVVDIITTTYWAHGDTVLNGKSYQIIKGGGNQELVRQDSGKVYWHRYGSQDDLLYDFNLNEGDTFYWMLNTTNPPFLLTDSVDTVDWGGIRKRIFLNNSESYYPYSEIWVEGIGTVTPAYYFPFNREIIADGPEFELLCYSEKGATFYQNPDYEGCFYDTLIYLSDKNISEEQVRTYPNPVSDFLFVDLPKNGGVDVCITTALGAELLCEKYAAKASIDMRLYPPGIYFLHIKTREGSILRKVVRG